jgi:hypothetical protein
MLWKSLYIILLRFTGLPVVIVLGVFAISRALRIWEKCIPAAMKSRLKTMKIWIGRSLEKILVVSLCIDLPGLLFIIFYIVLISIAPLYFAARLFIVVESFISLRHVPIGVYQTPNTNVMSYIPHL